VYGLQKLHNVNNVIFCLSVPMLPIIVIVNINLRQVTVTAGGNCSNLKLSGGDSVGIAASTVANGKSSVGSK
jgi:hypothetical protein